MAETRADPTHMSSSTITQTMGTLLRKPTAGARSSAKACRRWARSPSTRPSASATAKPTAILASEKPAVIQKAAVGTSSTSRTRTAMGPASSSSEPTAMLASCHTTSQNATAPARRRASRGVTGVSLFSFDTSAAA
jgi:hypothetical protein